MRPTNLSNLSHLLLILTLSSLAVAQKPSAKVSLRDLGAPQFPTAFYLDSRDNHYMHHSDDLFWLDSDRVALTFFKEKCCESKGTFGVKFVSVIFDATGRKMASHEWTSMPDDRFFVSAAHGYFLLQYKERVDVVTPEFTVFARMAVPLRSIFTVSKRRNQVALALGEKVSIYRLSAPTTAARLTVPPDTMVFDVFETAVGVRSALAASCFAAVMSAKDASTWILNGPQTKANGYCSETPTALLAPNVALIGDGVVSRDGASRALPASVCETHSRGSCALVSAVENGRLAFLDFIPNGFAEFMDLDFGGHKILTVFDRSSSTILLQKKLRGQAGAALSPDGHHLAIVNGSDLSIYSLP